MGQFLKYIPYSSSFAYMHEHASQFTFIEKAIVHYEYVEDDITYLELPYDTGEYMGDDVADQSIIYMEHYIQEPAGLSEPRSSRCRKQPV